MIFLSIDSDGYWLGCLFALIEYVAGGNKSSFRSRYFGAALNCPAVTFPRLLSMYRDVITCYPDIQRMVWLIELRFVSYPISLSTPERDKFVEGYTYQRVFLR